MGLESVSEWLNYCSRCNSCKYIYRDYNPSCPAFEHFLWESYTSSGKIWMARDLYEGKYPLTESIRDKIFSCTLCGNCTIQCQQEVSNHAIDIFQALREECVKNDLLLPAHKMIRNNIEKVENPYGENQSTKFEGIDEKYFKNKAEVALFIGCTTAFRNKELFSDILEILDHLDIDFTLVKDEWCCGSPLLTTGQKQAAQHLAEHNNKVFSKIGAKTIITACAGCYRTLKKEYPEKFGIFSKNSDINVQHISQYLSHFIKKNQFSASTKIKATYHDPCHLGRHMGIYEEPRNIIKKIKNVELIEMPRNRENAWCCGAGAGVKSQYKDWAIEISEARLREALTLTNKNKINNSKNKDNKKWNRDKNNQEKIDLMLSTCPFCERNLSDAHEAMGLSTDNLEVIDIITLLKRTIRNNKK